MIFVYPNPYIFHGASLRNSTISGIIENMTHIQKSWIIDCLAH